MVMVEVPERDKCLSSRRQRKEEKQLGKVSWERWLLLPVQTGKQLTSIEYAEITTTVCTKNMSLGLPDKRSERITANQPDMLG